jgi:hypothetical protein
MKNLIYKITQFSIMILLMLAFKACVNPEDLTTKDAKLGGGIVTIDGTAGKLTGVPDPATDEVTISDVNLSMTVDKKTGGSGVASYEIVKQYNGGSEITVESFNSLPHTTELNTIGQFLDGTGEGASDIRIGDVFTFSVKMTLNDGRIIYASSNTGVYKIVVNCSSDLAGTYTVTGIYNRPGSGIVNEQVGPRTEVVSEISPGLYGTELTGAWSLADLGVSACPVIFRDVCGNITIEQQYLCDYYGNIVEGTGSVDPATGNIHLEYSVSYPDLASDTNPRYFVFDFVKQ